MDNPASVIAPHPTGNDPWDVVIIGSGPSALTAAIYTTRGAVSTLILGGEKWGGQLMLTTEVDNFPGFPKGIMGPELMQNMRDQAERFGAKFVGRNATTFQFDKSPFEIGDDAEVYKARSVIVATGAETRWLGVPGESELIGRGISSCAPCDAPFFRDKRVIVVGGGDSAMEEALVLSKYATSVTIVHRKKEFRASEAMQKKVKENPKINVIWNKQVVEVVGQTKLEKVILEDIDTQSREELTVDGLFVAIGHIPACSQFEGLLELDEKGYMKKVPQDGFVMTTSKPGIFTAGDVHDFHYRQAITAAGFGCMAALEVLRYLDGV